MYDQHTDPKSDAAKHSLFKVRRMFQHLQINFELYWYPAQYLITNEKTIRFQGIHKDKLWITLKEAGDVCQADAVCDCSYTYYLIYCNYGITDSKNYLCTTSERVIWILKLPKTEWNHVYTDNLYNGVKLCRDTYAKKKLLHGVDRTHG